MGSRNRLTDLKDRVKEARADGDIGDSQSVKSGGTADSSGTKGSKGTNKKELPKVRDWLRRARQSSLGSVISISRSFCVSNRAIESCSLKSCATTDRGSDKNKARG